MQRATFCGRRGLECLRAVPARAVGWRLVFDKPGLIPIDEAYANVVPEPGTETFGVAYEITADDLAHVELTEGVLIGNYRRVEIAITALGEPDVTLAACTLVSDRRDAGLRPSDRYMACVIAGAEEHALPRSWIDFLRGVPARPQSSTAAALRPFIDQAFLRPKKP